MAYYTQVAMHVHQIQHMTQQYQGQRLSSSNVHASSCPLQDFTNQHAGVCNTQAWHYRKALLDCSAYSTCSKI